MNLNKPSKWSKQSVDNGENYLIDKNGMLTFYP